MKYVTGTLAALACAAVLGAADRIPLERAQQFAKAFGELSSRVQNPQIKPDVDTEKPCAIHAEDKYGAMVIPDRNLSEDTIAKATAEIKPLGHLWTRNLAPMVDNIAAPAEKLRVLTVSIENNDHKLPFFLLGVRKGKSGEPELIVYGKDKAPLMTVPLKKMSGTQELPIEIDGKKGENETGELVVNILGKYTATIIVKPLEL